MTKKEKAAFKAERDRLWEESKRLKLQGDKEGARSCLDKAFVYSGILINQHEDRRKKKAQKLIKRQGSRAIKRAERLIMEGNT